MTTGPSRPSPLGTRSQPRRRQGGVRGAHDVGRGARGALSGGSAWEWTRARCHPSDHGQSARCHPSDHRQHPPIPPLHSHAPSPPSQALSSKRFAAPKCRVSFAERAQHGPAAGGLAWGRADTHPPAPTRGIRAGPWQVSAGMKPALLCSSHICTPCAVQTPRRNQNLGTRDVSSAHVGSRCSALELTAFA